MVEFECQYANEKKTILRMSGIDGLMRILGIGKGFVGQMVECLKTNNVG